MYGFSLKTATGLRLGLFESHVHVFVPLVDTGARRQSDEIFSTTIVTLFAVDRAVKHIHISRVLASLHWKPQ